MIKIEDHPTARSSRIVNHTFRFSSLNNINQTIEFHKTLNMKDVCIDNLSTTEQGTALRVAGRAVTRRHRRWLNTPAPPVQTQN
jgi:hypothetical protein